MSQQRPLGPRGQANLPRRPIRESIPEDVQVPENPFQSQRASSQAFRDIDNLYGDRRFSSAGNYMGSDLSSSSHSQASDSHDPPRLPPVVTSSYRTQRLAQSQYADTPHHASIPLMSHHSPSPTRSSRISSSMSGTTLASAQPSSQHPHRSSRPMQDQNLLTTPFLDPLPRATSPFANDYTNTMYNNNDIVEDEDESFYKTDRGSRHDGNSSKQSFTERAMMLGGAALGSREKFKSHDQYDRPFSSGGASESKQVWGASSYKRSTLGTYSNDKLEKSEWLQKENTRKRKLKWIVGSIIVLIILAAVIGGIVGGVVGRKNSSGTSGGTSPASSNGGKLYDINSSQVKALLNDKSLHRVFPGMDYTPLNAQYPDCLSNPPDQNNITLDVAMLAQLTPAVRLYGTDCGQTEMVLKAIDLLGYNDTLKVWMGVWLGTNATTNTRQLQQMYDLLDAYPSSHFAGIIVGNEVLYRKDMSIAELGVQLQYVRTNLTAKGIDLPVATSDLGDDWTAGLVADTDIVMANIHPFFAGVTPDVASAWAWNFWQTHDVVLTSGAATTNKYPKHIISEIGWPSEGGNNCGTTAGCPDATSGAVASIDHMNTFMEGWVCPSLANGTTYFWFEAFDEPWKHIYDTDKDQWESKWGLMDANRKLKKGLTIPDCNGQRVNKPY